MDNLSDTANGGRQYSEIKNDQIEFQNFHSDDGQSSELTRDSIYQSEQPQFVFNDLPQHFGHNLIFKLNPLSGQPKYTLGPHWPLFLCAWGSFVAVDYLLIRMMWNNTDNIIWVILTTIICGMHVLSYLATALVNPGLAHKNDEVTRQLSKLDNLTPEQMEQMHCRKCDILKDSRTEHCDSCDVCVRGYDHHCPWSSKCIAKDNFKVFNVFLTMTFIFMAYAIVITVTTILPMNKRGVRNRYDQQDTYNNNNNNSTNLNF